MPTAFGWEHFLLLFLFIAAIVCICLFLKNCSERTNKIILIGIAAYLLIFEVFKQLSLNAGTGEQFNWFHAPFQPCSAVMYTILIAGILAPSGKKEISAKRRLVLDWCYCFLATYGLFSGISAVAYPAAIFSTTNLYILIQSPQHHALIALLGIYLMVTNRAAMSIKTFLKGLAVFCAWCLFALICNFIFYGIFKDPDINFMYVGPYTIWGIPVVADLLPFINNSYAIYLPLYIFLYSAGALAAFYLVIFVSWVCRKISCLIKNICGRKKAQNTPED
jgi:hypothetical protein